MATYSGTVYNVLGNAIGYTFSADVTYTQSIENNTTTLTITPKVSTGSDIGYAVSMYFKVDGVDYHNAYHNFSTWGNTYTASSYTKVINHNADGTKTFTLNVSFETTYTQGANANLNNGTPKSGTISQSITLPTIPRASSFSFNDFVMGTAGTITINRASSSFTHTLKYAFGNNSGTIGTGLGASASWTPSRDLGSQIPSSTSGVGTLTLETYSGSTHIGTSTKTFTLWIAGDMYPTFTSLSLSGRNLHSDGSYIQSVSSVTATITGATGSYGSTITSYSISGHGLNTSSSSGTSGVFTTSGNVTYTAKITDSRGRSATKTASIYVVPYQKPSAAITNIYRCDVNGNPQHEGTYVAFYADYSTTSLNNLSRTYTIKYQKTTEPAVWGTYIQSAWLSNVSGTIIHIIPNISVTDAYNISVTVADNYYNSTATNRIGAASCLINIEKDGVGIGKFHSHGALDIGGEININGYNIKTNNDTGDLLYSGHAVAVTRTIAFSPYVFSSTQPSANWTQTYSLGSATYLGDLIYVEGRVSAIHDGSPNAYAEVAIGGLPEICKWGYPPINISFISGITGLDVDTHGTRGYVEWDTAYIRLCFEYCKDGYWHFLRSTHLRNGDFDIYFSVIYKWR